MRARFRRPGAAIPTRDGSMVKRGAARESRMRRGFARLFRTGRPAEKGPTRQGLRDGVRSCFLQASPGNDTHRPPCAPLPERLLVALFGTRNCKMQDLTPMKRAGPSLGSGLAFRVAGDKSPPRRPGVTSAAVAVWLWAGTSERQKARLDPRRGAAAFGGGARVTGLAANALRAAAGVQRAQVGCGTLVQYARPTASTPLPSLTRCRLKQAAVAS